MKTMPAIVVAILALGSTGCVGDRTRNMAETCQHLLEGGGQTSTRTFLRDAEAQLASLEEPSGKLAGYLRDLQDPDAMKYKPALEQCLLLLKSRGS